MTGGDWCFRLTNRAGGAEGRGKGSEVHGHVYLCLGNCEQSQS